MGLSASASRISEVRFAPIVLKNSKIAGPRKSRKCSALAISAAARRCRIDTRASDRFCGNSCGPSPRSKGNAPAVLRIFGHQRKRTFSTQSVELRCGAVALGRTYPLPPLSFGGALLARPWPRFHTPLIGRVEDWRAGRPLDRATFPVPSTSHAACGFPALRAPICFTPTLMGPILLGRLSARRVALDRR